LKKIVITFTGILQIFIALGAIGGGITLIIKPDGSLMQMPLSCLSGSPFTSFLVPGLILLIVNGFGNFVAGILCFRQHWLAGFAGIFFGLGMMIWIFVQVNMIGGGSWSSTSTSASALQN
jgi:hypothetical protein